MFAKYKIDLEKTTPVQYIVAALLLLVVAGIFPIPLLDSDTSYYATVASQVLKPGDYHSFLNGTTQYFKQPHFLFWVEAISFKILGVTTFAYRLPHLLFSLVSVVSVYRLSKHIFDVTTAKLAALMLATSQAFIFSIVDARIEAPLTAAIAFSVWQLTVYIDKPKMINVILGALGSAIAFSTGGWLGLLVILVCGMVKIILQSKWAVLALFKTWAFVPLFFLFISPVLYSYFIEYDRLPKNSANTLTHTAGVAYLLWHHAWQRFAGSSALPANGYSHPFALCYHFLWAFAPWSIAAYAGVVYWLRRTFYKNKPHAASYLAVSFAVILLLLSFSRFQMQYHLLMLFPLAALFTAPYLRLALSSKAIQFYYPLHIISGYLMLAVVIALNFYLYKPVNDLIAITGIALLITLFILLTFKDPNKAAKVIYVSLVLSIAFNFFMTFNFFPNLIHDQQLKQGVSVNKTHR